jgi:hypothetical protein
MTAELGQPTAGPGPHPLDDMAAIDSRQMLDRLRPYLHPVIRDEVERLYTIEKEHQLLLDLVEEQRRRLHRAQAVAGDRSAELATLRGRYEDLAPAQVAIARRDATFLGHGYLRITARGRLGFDVERLAPGRVSVRDADH